MVGISNKENAEKPKHRKISEKFLTKTSNMSIRTILTEITPWKEGMYQFSLKLDTIKVNYPPFYAKK